MYVLPIRDLIQALRKLPSVGGRTAERFVFALLKSGKKDVAELTLALKKLIDTVKSCEVCWDFSDTTPCRRCRDTKRDASTICVVAESQDVEVVDKTGEYHGRYHILRGLLKAEDEYDVSQLKIQELLERILTETTLKEIILALNPTLPGETTMLYLEKTLAKIKPELLISRLARGLPMGSDIQYADEITLGSALKHRVRS